MCLLARTLICFPVELTYFITTETITAFSTYYNLLFHMLMIFSTWIGQERVDVMVAPVVTQMSSALIPLTGSRLSLMPYGICLRGLVGMVSS